MVKQNNFKIFLLDDLGLPTFFIFRYLVFSFHEEINAINFQLFNNFRSTTCNEIEIGYHNRRYERKY